MQNIFSHLIQTNLFASTVVFVSLFPEPDVAVYHYYQIMSDDQSCEDSAKYNRMRRSPPDFAISYNSRLDAILVQWVSPYEFYIQLKSTTDEFDAMMKEIQMLFRNRYVDHGYHSSINDFVIVFDKKRQEFLRGRIIGSNLSDKESDMHTSNVKLLDYGYEITCEQQDINEMHHSFMRLPANGFKCSLRGISLNKPCDEITKCIKELCDTDAFEIQCEFIKTVDNISLVELLVNGLNLRNHLVSTNLASLLPIGKYFINLI